MKRLLYCLLIGTTSLFAIEANYGLRKDHLQTKSGTDTFVDWTAGYISARAEVQIEDIRSGGGITRARDEATEKARELALSRALATLSRLPINGKRTIESEMRQDENLAMRMGRVSSLPFERSRQVAEGNVIVELILPFYGRRGFYSKLRAQQNEAVPEIKHNNPEDEITGVLIDATETSLEPVLEPRILTDQGRLIYGPGQADRSCYGARGLASFHASRELARKDLRLGESPYLLYATTRPGANGDLFISSQDAVRILGSKTGRNALRLCEVVIMLKAKQTDRQAE
ncbi:MAG: hypothetical protein K8S54_19130 [Spirochaetia bacterium]|nr:hypothetical protein [Spirochaetia bacterium]